MIVLDTCAMIFDSLVPERLSIKAREVLCTEKNICCSDISLWEIAMLINKKRLHPGTDCLSYIQLVLDARKITVLPITPQIAFLSTSMEEITHHDPADRIIAATAKTHRAPLVTADQKLLDLNEIVTIW